MKKILLAIVCILTSFSVLGQEWSAAQLAQANTAKNVDYLTEEEKQVIMLCNLARLDGALFASTYLAAHTPNNPSNWYVSSLYADLQSVRNFPMLYPNRALYNAAQYHANDMGRNGMTGHNSSNGRSFGSRLRSYGTDGFMGENCSYGHSDALNIVMQLLIDDGVASLGHRKNILNREYNSIGVSIAPHSVYSYNCVQDFARSNRASTSYTSSSSHSGGYSSSYSSTTSSSYSSGSYASGSSGSLGGGSTWSRYFDYNGKTSLTILRVRGGVDVGTDFLWHNYDVETSVELLTFRLWMVEVAWNSCRYNLYSQELFWEPQLRFCLPVAQRCAIVLDAGPSVCVLDSELNAGFNSCYFSASAGVRLKLCRYVSLDYKLGYNGRLFTSLDLAFPIPTKY